MKPVTLTRRGKFVAVTILLVAAWWFGTATANYCWSGHGYSSCIDITGPVK